ncbi:TAFII55 protein conserved region-domain-containing protein, partial [Lasiosphaeria miniovina]
GFPTAMSPIPQTPSGLPKIKLVGRKSLPPTPADPKPPRTPRPAEGNAQAGIPKITKTKPRSKLPSKRTTRHDSDDEDTPLANGTSLEPKMKKTKITLKPLTGAKLGQLHSAKTPLLKVKAIGRIPPRPLGEGYDSEAEDREIDPIIEEQFLLRMMPGEHCEYLQKAVQERRIGVPKSNGGADVQMKFLDDEGRRIMFTIQGQAYAAILLDLPTITEGMKSWDKKSMVKSADICQMLLVFAQVASEEEAKKAILPKAVEHGLRWPHGITPPMHDARNRRFRKRLSKLEIRNKEAEVERLLAADREAVSTKYEFVDEKHKDDEGSGDEYESGEEEDGEADADGEPDDYFGDAEALFEVDDALLEAEFMDAVGTPADPMDLATPAVGIDAVTPITANTGTPAAQTEESGEEGDSGDDEDEDDDGDDGGMDDDDGDEDRTDEMAGVRKAIADLKKQLAEKEDQLSKMQQPIMRKRIGETIKSIRSEIKLKQSSIGEVDED